MMVALQILGAIFLALVVLGFLAVLMIRAKLRQFGRRIEEFAKTALSAATPARIRLERLATAHWNDADAVSALEAPLAGFGFEKAGVFDVAEKPGHSLAAWVNSDRGVTAVVNEDPHKGVWIDLVTRFKDGALLTYSNCASGSARDHAPGLDVERFPGLSTRDLLQRLLAERPDRPVETPSIATFAATFEKAYADDMDQGNARGLVVLDHFHATGPATGRRLDDTVTEQTLRTAETQEMALLDRTLRARFRQESRLSAAEWEKIRDRVVVIHDAMKPDQFVSALMGAFDEDELPLVDLRSPGARAREVFASFNARLPEEVQLTRLGSVASPVEADVYAYPASLYTVDDA